MAPTNDEQQQEQERRVRCIGSAFHLRILCILHEESLSVQGLCESLGNRDQSTVSRHLRKLYDAGLIACQPQGRRNYYHVCEEALREVFVTAQQLAGLPP